MHCLILFPAAWIDSKRFDSALSVSGGPHSSQVLSVTFRFPPGCKVMVDAGVRLLSVANQLSYTTRRVTLDFEGGTEGTMGYLNRMGFFDHLAPEIVVFPQRPEFSGAEIYRGTNTDLVEIARINPSSRDEEIHTRLSKAVGNALWDRPDVSSIEEAVWTVFAELIDNIFSHSATVLDGYAAMQLYRQGNKVQVTVSDSGKGIMDTLKPSLMVQSPKLAALSDVDLLVEIFKQGLSRHGPDRGCGLKGSADKAMKYNAELEVRLPECRVLLAPADGSYKANTAYSYTNLPLIWGTHISFKFQLDTRR